MKCNRVLIDSTNELNSGKEHIKLYNDKEKLIFEGEFINGEENGKGKEYNDEGDLIYEGEFINGQKNGVCKEYYNGNKLKFEGEYLKGKKYNGKIYDFNNNEIYEIKNKTNYY